MNRHTENTGFVCEHCGMAVLPVTNGSYRNHCPFCLYAKHTDNAPGDRQCRCPGLMKPIGITHHRGKGMQIIHRCLCCGNIKRNRVAGWTMQNDDIRHLMLLPVY
jgi:hypothetical protein